MVANANITTGTNLNVYFIANKDASDDKNCQVTASAIDIGNNVTAKNANNVTTGANSNAGEKNNKGAAFSVSDKDVGSILASNTTAEPNGNNNFSPGLTTNMNTTGWTTITTGATLISKDNKVAAMKNENSNTITAAANYNPHPNGCECVACSGVNANSDGINITFTFSG